MAATTLTDKLTAIADAVRTKTGSTDTMTLDEMTEKISEEDTDIDTVIDGSITKLVLSSTVYIGSYSLAGCENLIALIVKTPSIPTLKSTALNSTPISEGTGYIYVPNDLVDSYKEASVWSNYADQITAIEGSEYE